MLSNILRTATSLSLKNHLTVCICLAVGLALFPASAAAQTTLTQTDIKKGYYSGFTKRSLKAITNDNDWQDLWDRHTSNMPVNPPDLPSVDFGKEMVIAAFMGEKRTGGYSIEIVKVEDDGTNIVVTYRETKPSGGFVTAALSQPFHMVRVPISSKKVVFRRAQP